MFSFGNKKSNPTPRAKPTGQVAGPKSRNLAQFGLLDLGFGSENVDVDDDDEDLEAELSALTRGTLPSRDKKARKQLVSEKELAAMISSSMADIPSDAEISDIDDADVEDELGQLCGEDDQEDLESSDKTTAKEPSLSSVEMIKLLDERIAMYKIAESNAIELGDTMKAKRFGRGVKSLSDLLKQAKAGKPIIMEDIPPPLAESNKTIQKSVPKETTPIPSILDAPISSQDTVLAPAPNLPLKPLVPVRVAPPPPPLKPAPPLPPRATISKPALVDEPNELKDAPISSSKSSTNIEIALARRQELKNAALQAKRTGDQVTALQFVRLVKICEQMIDTAKQGTPVDWSRLPALELENTGIVSSSNVISKPPDLSVEESKTETSVIQNDIMPQSVEVEKESTQSVQVPSIPLPRTTLEALEQRLAKYQSTMQQAQEEGNSSKVRRFGRIIKQYQDAIKLHKVGKPIPFDELPDPPGFPPIPGAPRKAEETEEQPPPPTNLIQTDETVVSTGSVIMTPETSSALRPPASGPVPKVPPKVPPKKTALATRQDKQLALLLERQNMFKQAALEAKKTGEIPLAKEYLRMAKGIDPLISANKCGIPVDMDTLPIPPQMKLRSTTTKENTVKSESATTDDFVILSNEECGSMPALGKEINIIFSQLEADLLVQLKMCTDNRDHYKLMGDIANANRFDQLALHTRKDLDLVRSSAMRGDAVPRWKNEMRTFSIVKCCTDLKDDDMEVTVLRGLSYNVANHKTIDTYVRFEVPIPNTENPTRERTNTVKDTNSPEYNETFHVNISRQSRTLLRIFKAKSIKFEVWSKGGFLRSDVLIGTATVKLADLLNHCQVHEAADIMDGRKPVGGKLEVKIRLRDPIVGKEMEQVQEKWTVLTH